MAADMRLTGDEDAGVSLDCYHPDCDPYRHGSVAYYGGIRPIPGMPHFDKLGDFLAFIQDHAKTHEQAS